MNGDFTSNHHSSIYSQWLPDTITTYICWYKMRIWKWGGLYPLPLHTHTDFCSLSFFLLLVICSFSQSDIRKHIHFLKLRNQKPCPMSCLNVLLNRAGKGGKERVFFIGASIQFPRTKLFVWIPFDQLTVGEIKDGLYNKK